jgi:uncharacterized phage protein (TIGR01671 family)
MRELKFRAWHETAKDYSKGRTSNMFQWIEEGQPIILEQYTGLKDKCCTEIYEGDIVSGVLYRDYSEHIGKIVFDYNGYMIVTKEKSMTLKLTEDLIVIGNIHQNAKLLEE